MENRKKVLNLLGLATRAGKTASGEFMTAMGKEMRASLAVLDSGFAKALREKLDD